MKLFVGDFHGNKHPQKVLVHAGAGHEDPSLETFLDDLGGLFRGRFSGRMVFEKLHGHHRADAVNASNGGVLRLHLQETFFQNLPDLQGPLQEVFLIDGVDHFDTGAASDRVPHVGSSDTASRKFVHDLCLSDHSGEGHTGGDRFGGGDKVGLDAEILNGIEFSRPSDTALNLIGDEENPVLVGDLPEHGDETGGGDSETTLALNGLNEEGGDRFGVDQVAEGSLEILDPNGRLVLCGVGHPVDVRGVRAEFILVGGGLVGQGHGQQGPPVEGVLEANDACAPGVGSGDLDGVLHSLGS